MEAIEMSLLRHPRHHNHLADARMQWNMQHAPRPYPIPSQSTLAYRSAKRRAAALGCNRAALASVPRRRRYTSIQVAAAEALRLRPHVCTRPPASDRESTPHRHSSPAQLS